MFKQVILTEKTIDHIYLYNFWYIFYHSYCRECHCWKDFSFGFRSSIAFYCMYTL